MKTENRIPKGPVDIERDFYHEKIVQQCKTFNILAPTLEETFNYAFAVGFKYGVEFKNSKKK